VNALAARRRHPAAIALLLLLGLIATGTAYAALAPRPAEASTASASQVEEGKKLFLANCASCHGKGAVGSENGPSLAGVGAAAVDFQMGTGRMPMTAPNVQAPRSDEILFSDDEISAIAAYVASLAPGPAVPSDEDLDLTGADPALGGEIFRVNCAMCHNFAGSGGALTRGKQAPSLRDTTPKHVWEAMDTGPQSMPVFNDQNITPENKRNVIAYLNEIENTRNAGGFALGSLGPVTEGLFAWVFGLGILVVAAVWLGQKGA
jgi:ubiquinol-cytochrome c reductase cytochrome c subunit